MATKSPNSTQPPAAEPPVSAPPAAPPLPQPTIYEAELSSGGSGFVICGQEIDLDAAVARRRAGKNVVVCGDDLNLNRRLAERIEKEVGTYKRGEPHKRTAGPRALPHFQQQNNAHLGHTFYETPNRRASRRKR